MKIEIPESINPASSRGYVLTIEVHPERFSFSLYNPVEDSSYFYCPLSGAKHQVPFDTFREAFFDNDFFSWDYRKVYVINYAPRFTYVPSLVFDPKDRDDYMRFLFTREERKVLVQELSLMNMVVLHPIEEEVYEFMKRSFLGTVFLHHTSVLISYFRDKGQMINGSRMIVNKQGDGLDVLCFSRDTFLFGNHFETKDMTDALYYILFVWKQLKFDQLKDFIYLNGDPDSKKELLELVKTYVHNVIPVNITPAEHLAGIDTSLIPLEMTALSLCEVQ